MTGGRLGGLACSDVLALLSDYLDGDLPPATRNRVEAHLSSCQACVRFGGAFANVLRALHRSLAWSELPPARVRKRLSRALAFDLKTRRGHN